MHFVRRSLVALIALSCVADVAFTQSGFVPEDLDRTGALAGAQALRIGADGSSVGLGIPTGTNQTHAIVFGSAGAHALSPLPGDDGGVANDRNAAGIVVGTSTDQVNIGPLVIQFEHPVMWTGGVPVDVRSLVQPGATTLDLRNATSINTSGQIVCLGLDQTAFDGNHTVIVDGGFVTDLGSLAISFHSETVGVRIDDLGRVVGYSFDPFGKQHAFLWDTTQMIDLHTSSQIQGASSQAFDLNRFGEVAGSADHAGGLFDKQTATIWNASGGGLDLGTLGGDQSVAYGINDLGVACGFSFTTLGEARAFVWKNGAMIDMNKMIDPNSGWVLVSARDIDESGRIVGDGEFMGSTRAFVALPQCDGSYTVYGSGCPAPGSAPTPLLLGWGCPSGGEPIALELTQTIPFTPGLLVVGTGNATAVVQPGCLVQTLPLTSLVFALPAAPPGGLYLPLTLPPVVPTVDLYVQTLFLFTPTNHVFGPKPLKIHLQ
ncbi:MAG: hypothetical protein IT459_03685 [Planctomycetes bacterium]|nr:hypothetical protein [Planctomycetota bacterium]